jgi:DHA2 family multidrug resistance protein
MASSTQVFKSWLPEWVIRSVIFIVLLPSMLLFGLSTANGSAAAGYYGIEPSDVQFTMIVFYAAVAGFVSLERRFFNFVATKEYFFICTAIQIAASYICYRTHNLSVLLIFRFIQGMANCGINSICLTLIFGRLSSERSREMGYSVFYCLLLCIGPFTTLITAPILDAYDFNVLYKFIIFCYVPGSILLFAFMNNIRLTRKTPVYQLDWASFVIYSAVLCLIGYILIYGQQYYWFNDRRILLSAVAAIVLFTLHICRQLTLKRPYHDLKIFTYRNYNYGVMLILVLYIIRGAMGVTSSYFATSLGMDPIHIAEIMLVNIAGIILSVIVSSRLIVTKKPMRLIWISGFLLLLVFHVWMSFLFSTQANAQSFIIPLIIQGMGAGMLMAPIIVFMVSSVPSALGGSASGMGVFFRFLGFSGSIALTNYFQLYRKSEHYNRFQDQLTSVNTMANERLNGYKQLMISRGVPGDQAGKIASGLLNRSVDAQAQLRFAMDYYQIISWLILITILLIALVPYINQTIVNVRSNQPAPASY